MVPDMFLILCHSKDGLKLLGKGALTHLGPVISITKFMAKRIGLEPLNVPRCFVLLGFRARIVDFNSQDVKAKSSASGSRHGASGIKVYGPMDRYLCRGVSNIPKAIEHEKPSYSSVCAGNDSVTSTSSAQLQGH